MAYGSDDFNYGVRMRKWRVKRREILADPLSKYHCPHCSNPIFNNHTKEPIFYDNTIQEIIDRCKTIATSTKGDLRSTTPKDNLSRCSRCGKSAFSWKSTKISKKRSSYELDDELFKL